MSERIEDVLSRVRLRPYHEDEICFPEATSRDPVDEIAADTQLMEIALQEWYVRQMFEHGAIPALKILVALMDKIGRAAITEYLNSPIIKESEPF